MVLALLSGAKFTFFGIVVDSAGSDAQSLDYAEPITSHSPFGIIRQSVCAMKWTPGQLVNRRLPLCLHFQLRRR
jgi:hypothetical protein